MVSSHFGLKYDFPILVLNRADLCCLGMKRVSSIGENNIFLSEETLHRTF